MSPKLRLTIAALALGVSAPALAALPVGAKAPPISANATLGGKPFHFDLAQAQRNGPVVLYFYPAAFTKGCSVEAHAFAEATDDFRKLGASVVGVSTDSIAKLNEFSVSACQSKFPLVSVDGKLLSAYRAKLPVIGKANRTSYVIAPDGTVIFEYTALNPGQHVARTMAVVKAWVAAHPAQ
jgi:peroxiredoxin